MQEDKQHLLHSEGGEIVKPGWWNRLVYPDHVYQKASVGVEVGEFKGFCGWETLVWLIKACDLTLYRKDQEYLRERDKALVSALFECGGRALETLHLRKSNFQIQQDKILAVDVPVLKRYKKVRSWVERVKELPKGSRGKLFKNYDEKRRCWWRTRWETEPVFAKRKPFPIWLREPLASILVNWIKQSEDYLFTPGKRSKKPHLEYSRVYKILKQVQKNFNSLVNEEAIQMEKVKLFPHIFRAWRASQLRKEYKYREFELKRFFAWVDSKMPFHYAALGVEDLETEWKVTPDMEKAEALLD